MCNAWKIEGGAILVVNDKELHALANKLVGNGSLKTVEHIGIGLTADKIRAGARSVIDNTVDWG